jgi:hypothetical protein
VKVNEMAKNLAHDAFILTWVTVPQMQCIQEQQHEDQTRLYMLILGLTTNHAIVVMSFGTHKTNFFIHVEAADRYAYGFTANERKLGQDDFITRDFEAALPLFSRSALMILTTRAPFSDGSYCRRK